jgi:ferritin-like metal-binding protein YciE
MDTSPDVLAEEVRAKRTAIDNDLELLRVRVSQADPRRNINPQRLAQAAAPLAAGAALWMFARRRRAVGSLEQLLIHTMGELYKTELTLMPALERMRAAATNPDLASAFEQHRRETDVQLDRLERAFRSIGAKPKRGISESVAAIVAEGERLLKRKVDPDVRDAWLIATAQRAEHLEISGYGTARTFAQTLGHTYAAGLLNETLEEERATDEKLTRLAERFVNLQSIR